MPRDTCDKCEGTNHETAQCRATSSHDHNEQTARDLLAWAVRLIEPHHDEGCPAIVPDDEGGDACNCTTADFASAVFDLDIEPCARCDRREATEEVEGIPICDPCRKEVA
jgi:hypothetical protein